MLLQGFGFGEFYGFPHFHFPTLLADGEGDEGSVLADVSGASFYAVGGVEVEGVEGELGRV